MTETTLPIQSIASWYMGKASGSSTAICILTAAAAAMYFGRLLSPILFSDPIISIPISCMINTTVLSWCFLQSYLALRQASKIYERTGGADGYLKRLTQAEKNFGIKDEVIAENFCAYLTGGFALFVVSLWLVRVWWNGVASIELLICSHSEVPCRFLCLRGLASVGILLGVPFFSLFGCSLYAKLWWWIIIALSDTTKTVCERIREQELSSNRWILRDCHSSRKYILECSRQCTKKGSYLDMRAIGDIYNESFGFTSLGSKVCAFQGTFQASNH